MMSSASYYSGDFQASLYFSEQAIELDDRVNCTHKAPIAGADPAIVARDYLEMALLMMGHLERALSVSEQSMAIALDRGHLFSIVWAGVSRIAALASFGRFVEAIACADHALDICQRHGFNSRIGNVLRHRGPLLFELGDEERGLVEIEQGLSLWRKRSGQFLLARNLAKLAEYQLRADQNEQAGASLDEAQHLAETTEEKHYPAEIVRLRGRLWHTRGDQRKARHYFELAIAQARTQGARLLELNAARDLATLEATGGGGTRGA